MVLGCIKRWISIGCSGFIGIYGWGTYVIRDIYNNKSSMMYCMASFNSSYLVLFGADDYFYNYAGKLINIIITEMRYILIMWVNLKMYVRV